jgi:y4mF family transcriptional regulator
MLCKGRELLSLRGKPQSPPVSLDLLQLRIYFSFRLGSINIPIGNFKSLSGAITLKFPDREILVDNTWNVLVYFPYGKVMLRHTLTPAEIGEMIRTTRKAAGLRQPELAGAAGVGLRFIVDLEAGKPSAHLGKTLLVLSALGCDLKIVPPVEAKNTSNS